MEVFFLSERNQNEFDVDFFVLDRIVDGIMSNRPITPPPRANENVVSLTPEQTIQRETNRLKGMRNNHGFPRSL